MLYSGLILIDYGHFQYPFYAHSMSMFRSMSVFYSMSILSEVQILYAIVLCVHWSHKHFYYFLILSGVNWGPLIDSG